MVLTTAVHPASGQGGKPEGTSYVVTRFHGVLHINQLARPCEQKRVDSLISHGDDDSIVRCHFADIRLRNTRELCRR